MIRSPEKEHGANKSLQERSKGDVRYTTDLPESSLLKSILAEECVCHQERPLIRMIGQSPPRNEFHHHNIRDCKPRSISVVLDFLAFLLSPRAPLPNKMSCFVSLCVFSSNSFLNVRQSPLSSPKSPSCNKFLLYWVFRRDANFIFLKEIQISP